MKHTMLKCLSLVMALATLVSVCALPAIVQAATPCNHWAYEEDWTYVNTQEPTCTEWGGKVYTCPKCEQDFVDSRDWDNGEYKPLGHDYVEVEGSRTNPTLEEPGEYKVKCSRCDDEKTETISALDCELQNPAKQHNWNTTDTATCTEEGVLTKTCKNCPRVVTEVSAPLGHTWDQGTVVKPPECGEFGTIKFVCTVEGCEGERVDDKVLPHSTSHKWEWFAAVPVTCGDDGNTAGYKCVYCDAVHPTDPFQIIETEGHKVLHLLDEDELEEAGLENVALGCVDEVVWGLCSVCDEFVDVSDATATGKGTYPATGIYKPGQTWQGNHYVKAEKDAATGKWVVTEKSPQMYEHAKATCKLPAQWACSVTDCSYLNTNVGEANGHDWAYIAPTCSTPGVDFCVCGATRGWKDWEGNPFDDLLQEEAEEKYGIKQHAWVGVVNGVTVDYTNTKVHTPASCTEFGYNTFRCIWCCDPGETVDVIIPTETPIGHLGETIAAVAPTCTTPGNTEGWHCLRLDCSDRSGEINSVPLPETGHGDWVLVKNLPANCQWGERDAYVCSRCDRPEDGFYYEDPARNPEKIYGPKDPSKHNFDESRTVLETAPTCTTPGRARKYCTYCFDVDNCVVEQTYHSFQEVVDGKVVIKADAHVVKVPATCSSQGYYVYVCTHENCDITYGTDAEFKDGTVIGGVTFVHANFFDYNKHDADNDQFVYHYNHNGEYPYKPAFNADGDLVAVVLDWTGVAHDSDNKTTDGVDRFLVGGEIINGKGSCTIKSWYEYNCACGIRYQELREDDFGLTGSHVYEKVADVPATCTVPGWENKYVCTRCAMVDETRPGNEVTAAHTFDTTITAGVNAYSEDVDPTCTEFGWDKKGFCIVCQAVKTEGDRQPTGHTAPVDMNVAIQFIACGVEAWDAHYNCINADCNAVVNNAKLFDAEGNPLTGDDLKAALANQDNWVASISTKVAGAYINGYAPARVHNMVLTGVNGYGCLDDGYQWFVCAHAGCDHVYVDANYYFGFVNHRYTDTRDYNVRADGTLIECLVSHLYCDNDVQKTAKVENGVLVATVADCDAKDPAVEAREILPHTNAKNEAIKGFDDCTKWDKNQDHVCIYCEVDFNFKNVHDFTGKDIIHTVKTPDCVDRYGYDLYTCRVCNSAWHENQVESTRPVAELHVWREVTAVAPTHAAPGYTDEKCSVCGDTRTIPTDALAGVKFDLTVANKNAGYEIFDGSIIAVKVTTSAYNVGATSIKVTMAYNADVFTFVGFTADNGFSKTPVSFDLLSGNTYAPNATNAAYANNGVVTMVSVAEKTAGGQLQEVNLKGTETYMTLYFRVATDATTATAPFGFNIVESTATEENTQVLGLTTDPNGAVVKTSEKVVIGTAVELASTVKLIGDINGDTIIGMEDIEAMRKIVLKAEGYTAPVAGAADIDKDGDVDLDDYALLQKVMLGMADYQVLAAALDVDADGDCDADDCTLFIEYVVAYKALNLVF